jgi:methylthioribose-1-phosphate isomerase
VLPAKESDSVTIPQVVIWTGERVRLLDQRKLPDELAYADCESARDVAESIRNMTVRGAPAIGIAAGFGMALAAVRSRASAKDALLAELEAAAAALKASRPTAVNLAWAVDRVLRAAGDPTHPDAEAAAAAADAEAQAIAAEGGEADRRMGSNGSALVPDGARILHHCNTGFLATAGIGTALGVIRTAHEHGKAVHVFVDETRPRLQGARLTAWELDRLGIPHTLIVDGAAAFAMRRLRVDLCLVGADRVAANGDVANKIGTYGLALAASAHGIPFYVACPWSTMDPACPSGDRIPIVEREASEVLRVGRERIPPEGTTVWNPAFDVTPAGLVTAFITERGVIRPPFRENFMLVNPGGIP